MPPIAIALIVILAVHYFLAIATLFVLLRDRGVTKSIIVWDLVILLIPILGPCAYWIARTFDKKKASGATGAQSESAPAEIGGADGTEVPADGRNETKQD